MRKKGKVAKKRKFFKLLSQNKTFVMLSIFFLFGIFIGAISSENFTANTLEKVNNLFLNNIHARETAPILYIFITSLSASFLFILTAFFMGLSMWGCVLAPAVPLIRGFCLGISQNYIYCTYGLKGIGFQLVILLPGLFISSLAILLMAREAIRLSHNFSSFMLFGEREPFGKKNDIQVYLLRTGLVLAISIFASVVDIVLNTLFLRFFHF